MTLETNAILYSTRRHDGQFRKYTGEPYIYHPLEVANIVRTVAHDQNMIVAAIFHDVVEDTCKDESERIVVCNHIITDYGTDVLDLVMDLTDVSKPTDGSRAKRKAIDRAHTAAASPRAKTVKLADLISNTSTIVMHDPDFAKVYLEEKALLLDEALKAGNLDLWTRADKMIREAMAQVALDPRCRR